MSRAPRCIECSNVADLVMGERIYPHRPDLHAKYFWLCECGAYCGCHPESARTLGRPAGPLTRFARSRAHYSFDSLWKKGRMSRGDAYRWLRKAMGLPKKECHIGMMDSSQAMKVVALVRERGET